MADLTGAQRIAMEKRTREQHRRMDLTTEGPTHQARASFADAFASMGLDNTFDIERFAKNLRIHMRKAEFWKCEFDIIGIDPPIANAFRRILISEVPSVAIDKVHLFQNTGVLHDEVLAHRLGLMPMAIEPDKVQWPEEAQTEAPIMFKLDVKCETGERSVTSGDLVWVPASSAQEAHFGDSPPKPVHDDVLLTKLRPGQEIEAQCYCEKGTGAQHAKWSPVCTAFYKLLPELELCDRAGFLTADSGFPATAAKKKVAVLAGSAAAEHCRASYPEAKVEDFETYASMWAALRGQRVHATFCATGDAEQDGIGEGFELLHVTPMVFVGEKAQELVEMYPGVFALENGAAVVADARLCTSGQGMALKEAFGDLVRVSKVKDHFVFSVESTGVIPAPDLFRRAIAVFRKKVTAAAFVLTAQRGGEAAADA